MHSCSIISRFEQSFCQRKAFVKRHLDKVAGVSTKSRRGTLEALDSLDCVMHGHKQPKHRVLDDRRQGGEAGHALQA